MYCWISLIFSPNRKVHILRDISFCCIWFRTHSQAGPSKVRSCNFGNGDVLHGRSDQMFGHHGQARRRQRSNIPKLRQVKGSWDKLKQQRNVPWVPAKQPQKDEQHPEQMLMAHKIAKQPKKYMMPAMYVLHEPINMKQVMSGIKPSIKNQHIDKDLLDCLEYGKLVLSTCPVSVVRCDRINFPQPDYGIQYNKEESAQTQCDFFLCVFSTQLIFREGVCIFQCRTHDEVCGIISQSNKQECPAKLGEIAYWQHTHKWILNWSDMGDAVTFDQADNLFLNGLIRHLNFKIKVQQYYQNLQNDRNEYHCGGKNS